MNIGNTASAVRVNAIDTGIVRGNQSPNPNSVDVRSIYDIDKNGRVNAIDTGLVRGNQTNPTLGLFKAPDASANSSAADAPGTATPPLFWLKPPMTTFKMPEDDVALFFFVDSSGKPQAMPYKSSQVIMLTEINAPVKDASTRAVDAVFASLSENPLRVETAPSPFLESIFVLNDRKSK